MPIFEYRCSACDHLEEVLQKHSDPPPDVCPACGKAQTLAKELSRTSFQLKGGGWYKDLYSSTSATTKKDDGGSSSSSSSGSSGGTASTAASSAAPAAAPASTSSSGGESKAAVPAKTTAA
jgi:putative FmdB family regulatory protein